MAQQDENIDVKVDRDPENKTITVNIVFQGKHLYSSFAVKDEEKENDRLVNREISRMVRREIMKRSRDHANFLITDVCKIPAFTGGYKYATVEEQQEAKRKRDSEWKKNNREHINAYNRAWRPKKKQSPIEAT
jgi:hypothetical protein